MSTLDFLDPGLFVSGAPFDAYRELREKAPVAWREHSGESGEKGYWLLTRHQDIQGALLDAATFSSWLGTTSIRNPPESHLEVSRLLLINMDPPGHTRYRRLITKSFASRTVERLAPRLRELSTVIVDRIAGRGECDFVADVASRLPMQVICELLGVPEQDWGRLYTLSNAMISPDDPDYNVSAEDTMSSAMEMYGYSASFAEERRARPREDLMSALIAAEVDGQKLTEGEINAFFLLLVVAGNETTRNLLAGGLLALFDNPGERARLMADPGLWPSAVEEMLRYVSPVMQWRRTVNRDVTLHGQTLREGDRVILSLIAGNRDERVFADPERFDVSRSPNPHLAFGFGPHLCLGASLARLEARLLFEELFRRLPDVAPAGPVARLRSNFVHGIKRMPIRFTPA